MGQKLEWAARPQPWLAFALALGLALRGYHYLSNPAVWHDEAALMVNVLGKGYAELLGPLFYSEAGPPLFLWVERTIALLLGDSTFALRLVPFLASCAALLGSVALARQLLPAWGVVWFTLLFGCSDRLLWHACEAKPYAVDVLVAVGLLATFIARRPEDEAALGRRLVLYAALAPVLIFLSFPSCFLLGGAALALLPAVVRTRSRRVWAAYLLFGLLMCGSFGLLVVGPVQAQKNESMFSCWLDNFPDWERPWSVPWLGVVRLTEACRYACEPIGNGLTLFAGVGAFWFGRRGEGRVLAFLLVPLGLTALAWLAHQYPLGAARVDVFAAPAVLLLVAAGLPPVLCWLARRAWPAAIAVAVVVLFPMWQAGYRVAVPWQRLDSAGPAAFVLRQRAASEPVVGTLWEHRYYFRGLGPLYRTFTVQPTEPPALPPLAAAGLPGEPGKGPRAVDGLWVVAMRYVEEKGVVLEDLRRLGEWSVAGRYPFADMVVLHVVRAGPVASAPVRQRPAGQPITGMVQRRVTAAAGPGARKAERKSLWASRLMDCIALAPHTQRTSRGHPHLPPLEPGPKTAGR